MLISKVLQEEDDLKGTRSTSHGRTIARKPMLLLAAVLAAALALRLLHLYAVSQTAFVDFHRVFTAPDMHTTWQWAKQIAASDWLGRPPYHSFGNMSKGNVPRETWERWRGDPMVFQQSPRRRLWEINFLGDLEPAVETPPAKPAPQPSGGDRR